MAINPVNRVKSIAKVLGPFTGAEIITLAETTNITIGTELYEGHTVVSYSTFVKNLKAYASIKSLPEVPLPDFLPEDSETDKLIKVANIEWASPRKQLTLYIRTGSNSWMPVGSLSLLNPSGYPFRIYNLMDLYTDNLAIELGEETKIGIGIDDVGYGLLQALDSVTIHGSFVEEIYVASQSNIIVNIAGGSLPSSTTRYLDNVTFFDNNTFLEN